MKNSQKGSVVVIILVIIVIVLLGIIGYSYLKPVQDQQVNLNPKVTDIASSSDPVVVLPNDKEKAPSNTASTSGLVVVSPNGGEEISYGNIMLAGDLYFSWKLPNENSKPTSKLTAYLLDQTNMVVRDDFIKRVTSLGNNMFETSFIGAENIQSGRKYRIKVCDEINGVVKCDVSDNYFTVVSQ